MNGVRGDIERGEVPCIDKPREDVLKELDINIYYLKGKIMQIQTYMGENIKFTNSRGHRGKLFDEVSKLQKEEKRKTKRKKSKNLKKQRKI